jgi:hypothetical protein
LRSLTEGKSETLLRFQKKIKVFSSLTTLPNIISLF